MIFSSVLFTWWFSKWLCQDLLLLVSSGNFSWLSFLLKNSLFLLHGLGTLCIFALNNFIWMDALCRNYCDILLNQFGRFCKLQGKENYCVQVMDLHLCFQRIYICRNGGVSQRSRKVTKRHVSFSYFKCCIFKLQ